jgi:hypothetical protein
MGGKSKKDNSAMQFQMQQAQEARDKEAARQGRLDQGTDAINQSFLGFDDSFYGKYKDAYLADQLPQLDRQYQDTRKKLTFDAADAGNLRSKSVGRANQQLSEDLAVNKGKVTAAADTAVGDYRSNVQGQKNALVSQLYGTEDPAQAANNATSVVSGLNQLATPALPSLGQMFAPLIIGGGAAAQGYADQTAYNKGLQPKSPQGQGSGKTV